MSTHSTPAPPQHPSVTMLSGATSTPRPSRPVSVQSSHETRRRAGRRSSVFDVGQANLAAYMDLTVGANFNPMRKPSIVATVSERKV